ncbi:hypothetical protein BGM09_14295 [Streptomyces sp. CBMA29]|nr:hypothetical protein [Streptomyces sp. CBMA29]
MVGGLRPLTRVVRQAQSQSAAEAAVLAMQCDEHDGIIGMKTHQVWQCVRQVGGPAQSDLDVDRFG